MRMFSFTDLTSFKVIRSVLQNQGELCDCAAYLNKLAFALRLF
jgi:hypothetical protein